jgi:Putative prokaryotic signal transducing protein
MSADDLVILSTFNNHIQADLARSALDAMGIESMVRADDAGGEQPGLWIGEGVQILVRERDAELAKMVISGSASGT